MVRFPSQPCVEVPIGVTRKAGQMEKLVYTGQRSYPRTGQMLFVTNEMSLCILQLLRFTKLDHQGPYDSRILLPDFYFPTELLLFT